MTEVPRASSPAVTTNLTTKPGVTWHTLALCAEIAWTVARRKALWSN